MNVSGYICDPSGISMNVYSRPRPYELREPCEYCGTLHSKERCDSCGAPKKEQKA